MLSILPGRQGWGVDNPGGDVALKIAVVICTLRRPRSLERALASLAGMAPPRHAAWQVLVVDNFGWTETQGVVARFRDRLPIEVVIEPTMGLAHARNAAIAGSACDYFVWTDDDVTVSEGWLAAYEAAFDEYPSASFFGGPIVPKFEGTPPEWITACLPHIYTAFAGRDLSNEASTFDRRTTRFPFGANMAIRAAEQRRFLYDTALGRQPGPHMLSGEDVDVLKRICQHGGTGVWVPGAVVDHWIDRRRQSIAYLRRYYKGISLGQARAQRDAGLTVAWSDSLSAWWQLIGSDLTYLRGRIAGKPDRWVKALK